MGNVPGPQTNASSRTSVSLTPPKLLEFLQHDQNYSFIALMVVAQQVNIQQRLMNLYHLLTRRTELSVPVTDTSVFIVEGTPRTYDWLDEVVKF